MKKIGKMEFPETQEEAQEWKPYQRYTALSMRVLCIATSRIEGQWRAYCDAVQGWKHDEEYQEVLMVGDTLPEKIALAIFPEFEGIPYSK